MHPRIIGAIRSGDMIRLGLDGPRLIVRSISPVPNRNRYRVLMAEDTGKNSGQSVWEYLCPANRVVWVYY